MDGIHRTHFPVERELRRSKKGKKAALKELARKAREMWPTPKETGKTRPTRADGDGA